MKEVFLYEYKDLSATLQNDLLKQELSIIVLEQERIGIKPDIHRLNKRIKIILNKQFYNKFGKIITGYKLNKQEKN